MKLNSHVEHMTQEDLDRAKARGDQVITREQLLQERVLKEDEKISPDAALGLARVVRDSFKAMIKEFPDLDDDHIRLRILQQLPEATVFATR